MMHDDNSGSIHLSIVAPAYNEADNLPALIREMVAAGEAVGKPYEIVIADDASTDDSLRILSELQARVPTLRVLRLRENRGQSAALHAALLAARGRFVATLDSDLQNDPADIPALLKIVEAGECDLLQGWRQSRQDTGLRRFVSKYGNRVRRWLTGDKIHDSGCGLKVFRRECVDGLKVFNGMHRYFATLVRIDGFRVDERVVNHRPRTAGVAKYGFWNRIGRVMLDLLALRWMQMRAVRYQAQEVEASRAAAPTTERETASGTSVR